MLALVAAAGCEQTVEDPVATGDAEIAWSVTIGGEEAECGDVGVANVFVFLDDAASAMFACDALGGVITDVRPGAYDAHVSLLDLRGDPLRQEGPIAVTVTADGVTPIGPLAFDFEPEEDDDDDEEPPPPPPMCDPAVTIARVYAQGDDYVVLKNRRDTEYALGGHSLQVSDADATTWQTFALPPEAIPADGYYLIALGPGAVAGADVVFEDGDLPETLDLVVALVATATPLDACPTDAIDLFSAAAAGCAEGATEPAPGANEADEEYVRDGDGCTDSDDNSADFAVATASAPPSSGSPPLACTCP